MIGKEMIREEIDDCLEHTDVFEALVERFHDKLTAIERERDILQSKLEIAKDELKKFADPGNWRTEYRGESIYLQDDVNVRAWTVAQTALEALKEGNK